MAARDDRLGRIEAHLAARDVLARCCHMIDGSDVDAWLDCFTPDARWTATGMFTLEGREALRDWFTGFKGRAPTGTQTHLTLNERITLTATGAEATSNFVVVRAAGGDGDPEVVSVGLYRDALTPCDDGVWRITERTSTASIRRR